MNQSMLSRTKGYILLFSSKPYKDEGGDFSVEYVMVKSTYRQGK